MEFFTIQYKANNCPTFKAKVVFPAVLLLQPEIRDFVCQNSWHQSSSHALCKHSKKCTFYTLRFGCSFAAVNTIKPQLL